VDGQTLPYGVAGTVQYMVGDNKMAAFQVVIGQNTHLILLYLPKKLAAARVITF